MTPTLSVDAVHESEMVVSAAPVFVRPLGFDGGWRSVGGGGGGCGVVHGDVEVVSEARAERLPAASTASTPNVTVAPQASPLKVLLVEPVLPADALFTYRPYSLTPTLSVEAVHETVTEPEVEPVFVSAPGTVGAWVSFGGGGGFVGGFCGGGGSPGPPPSPLEEVVTTSCGLLPASRDSKRMPSSVDETSAKEYVPAPRTAELTSNSTQSPLSMSPLSEIAPVVRLGRLAYVMLPSLQPVPVPYTDGPSSVSASIARRRSFAFVTEPDRPLTVKSRYDSVAGSLPSSARSWVSEPKLELGAASSTRASADGVKALVALVEPPPPALPPPPPPPEHAPSSRWSSTRSSTSRVRAPRRRGSTTCRTRAR